MEVPGLADKVLRARHGVVHVPRARLVPAGPGPPDPSRSAEGPRMRSSECGAPRPPAPWPRSPRRPGLSRSEVPPWGDVYHSEA